MSLWNEIISWLCLAGLTGWAVMLIMLWLAASVGRIDAWIFGAQKAALESDGDDE